jgi:hypothetical protein
VAWDPYAASSAQTSPVTIHDAYFGGVFRALESLLETRGLTVYLTWDLEQLPSYGRDVVAVVLGDEWCRCPAYTSKTLAVFKCYGTRPNLPAAAVWPPTYLRMLTALQLGRLQVSRLPGVLRETVRSVRAHLRTTASRSTVYSIPLGYANQSDRPIRPVAERSVDLFFAGSLSHNRYPVWSPLHWLRSPKHVAREQMVAQAARLADHHPEVNVQLKVTSDFAPHAVMYGRTDAEVLDRDQYSALMMNTRICLAPRGTSPETFRFFEGLRAGCVVVSDVLPRHWFYDGSPALEIGDWRDLEDLVLPLLRNPDRLDMLHTASLRWWTERCSEAALAAFMADVLRAKLSASVPAAAPPAACLNSVS